MAIDTTRITKLRELTGAGIADIKKALDEAGNDEEKAIELLRKKGALKAAKKMVERTAGDGVIDSYIHATGKVGVLVEVRCETDFVARNEDFKTLVHEIALQIAGANPYYVKPEDVPTEVIAKEKEVYLEQLKAEGKPENIIEKIIEGKLQKYFSEFCLLNQPTIKDDSLTVGQAIEQMIAKLGEKIEVTRFSRFQI